MSHPKILLLPLAALVLCLTACGGGDSTSSPAETPAAFGASALEDAPRELADTVPASEAPGQNAPAGSVLEAQSADPIDMTEQAVACALAAELLDGFTYDPGDSGYFWRALGYLIGLGGDPAHPVRDGRVTLPEQALAPYVTALFGPYTGQYPSLGEENPLVSQEGGMYTVTASALPDHSLTMTEPEPQGDGTYRCHAEFSGDSGAGSYTVTLTDAPQGSGGSSRFPYCITGISEG